MKVDSTMKQNNEQMAPAKGGMSVLASSLPREQIPAGATECVFDIGKSSDGPLTKVTIAESKYWNV